MQEEKLDRPALIKEAWESKYTVAVRQFDDER